MNYRSDIDGLRALAIVPVVLYHANGAWLPGGFVGVDVFFVISGYLITLLVKREIEGSSFSLAKFYERRARRILPALMVMMGVVLLFGLIALPPKHLEELSSSTAAAALFYSNIHFWMSIGYFSTDAEFWPLLHTWSLSVEEQFYLFHPLLLLLLLRSRRWNYVVPVLLAVIAVSLFFCLYATPKHPSASFYLLPFRYWELALGALGAFLIDRRAPRGNSAGILSFVGLMAIIVGITRYEVSIPFPGGWAALPAVGTLMVIVSGPGTFVARGLSWRPLVSIGLISYSLYLWHWPVLAYARYAFGSPELPVEVSILCVLLSVVLSVLSWRYVERPFRQRGFLRQAQVFALSLAATAAVSALGWYFLASAGLPQRLTSEELVVAASIEDYRSVEDCWGKSPAGDACVVGRADGGPGLLLWGDSHAGALVPAFDEALQEAGYSGVVAARGACAPLIGVRRVGYQDSECDKFNREVIRWLQVGEHGITRVVLIARWNLNATGVRPRGEAGAAVRLIRSDRSERAESQAEVFEAGLARTVKLLREMDLEVILLDDTPEVGWNVPMATLFRQRLGLSPLDAPDAAQLARRSAVAHAAIRRVATQYGARFVTLNGELCKPKCILSHQGRPLYSDDDHISNFGARRVIAPLLLQYGVLN